jgi:uncharacterized protein
MRQLTGNAAPDRVGIDWRPELGAATLSHLDEIDVLEVLIEDCLYQSRRQRQAQLFLAAQVPVIYHGVALGPASVHPVDRRRLDRVARFLDSVRASVWSEHLAFVRAGGVEIGHLAAPPRTPASMHGACENLRQIERLTGLCPALENIATLLQPPGSILSEAAWIEQIASTMQASLLLDLHNLLCNAVNTGIDPKQALTQFPLERVTCVHLSGGRWLAEPAARACHPGARRLLDDHLHAVPTVVFDLLTAVAARVPQPLTVIIERDGNFPAFIDILDEIRRARAALALGRSQRNPIEEAEDECSRV